MRHSECFGVHGVCALPTRTTSIDVSRDGSRAEAHCHKLTSAPRAWEDVLFYDGANGLVGWIRRF
jgi:hypothetical protein